MKKISLILTLALSLGFVSCDDFDLPNPPAQTNPQEPAFEAGSLTMASLTGASVIDLAAVNAADGLVTLAEVTAVENLPEGYELSFVGQMAASDAFASVVEFPTTVTENKLMANPDDLDAAFHEVLNTIDPSTKAVNIRYKAYAVNGTSSVRLGGADVYFCPMTANVTPFAPDFTVEEAYYLIGTCTDGKIDASKAIKMSNSGLSPYDDPHFSVVVDITADEAAAGYKWAVVPQSTLAAGSGQVLCAGGPALVGDFDGYLTSTSFNDVIFCEIEAENKHLISVNVRPEEELYAFSVMLAIPNLWTPGPANGWNQAASQLLYTYDYKHYEGYVHIDGEFKFTSAPDWAHTNYGFKAAGELDTDPGAGNIKVTQDGAELTNGLYFCKADIVTLTYSIDAIHSYAIIGDGTPGGWDAETAMTPSDDFLKWTLKTTLTEGKEFKFRANNGWDINLGGSLDDLQPGAANIPVPVGGEVTITLDLSSLPYTATVTQ